MKTVCSLISPVVAFMKRARTKIGAEKVMSFSLHSSTENFGGGPQVLVVGVELQLELQGLGEVLDRADVAEGLSETLVQEPLERFALDGDQVGQLECFVEVGERIAFTDRRASRQG